MAKRFTPTHLAGIEAGIGELNTELVRLLPEHRRLHLLTMATIDGNTTDVEVYARHKQDAIYNDQGQLAYRPHIAFWGRGWHPTGRGPDARRRGPPPGRGRSVGPGDQALPPGVEEVQCRWDSGYFAADLAIHCVQRDIDFAIGVKRNTAVVRACRSAPADGWHPVIGMKNTEVPTLPYLPGALAHRRRDLLPGPAQPDPGRQIPNDQRARKLRTIDKDQLELALAGRIDDVCGYSFILTNGDVSTAGRLAEVEH